MLKASLFLWLGLINFNLYAFPEAPHDALEILAPESNGDDYDFEGIVKLSNCSGSVIHFKGQPLSAKALVLTNGHCLGRPFVRPGAFILNKKSQRPMKVADSNRTFHPIRAQKIIYGTMTTTDAAIYEIQRTYRELQELGIRPFELNDRRPEIRTAINIISGYWERGYHCKIDDFVYLLREEEWSFSDSIRYTSQGCKTIGGTSGAPIIMDGTRTVIGVNNTGNQSGRRCTTNNPCEVDRSGRVTVRRGASYGQQTYLFYGCLNSDYEIDLNLPTCQLPK